MDEAQHTPGSWYVYIGEDREAIAVQKFVDGDNGGTRAKTICRMPVPKNWGPTNSHLTRSEIDANARLIAAAPELQAASNLIIAAINRENGITADKDDDWIYDVLGGAQSTTYFAVRAALTKSTP